ncbi:hypothetical protein PNU17_12330 [Turicibacter sanguinis]|uniref:hypothetical protein n=1 Tax=Turicibacter sanguinis TaxID=154288 RepID=UPI001898764D|nr:hypothetical protein [Turicibacter sanguinis]MDB8556555.1 hypothetical protein [Turicibacter sanguinis]
MNIINHLEKFDKDIIVFDNLDQAIIEILTSRPNLPPVAVYDIEKCIEILMHNMNSSYEIASEYFYYNIFSIYLGNRTPIFK